MTDKKMQFVIDGRDYSDLEEFHMKHKLCLEKHPNMTGAQYVYSFTSDSFGTVKSCKCVCGKTITLGSDYDLSLDPDTEHKLKVTPEDEKTKEIVHILQSMHVRPKMYFRIKSYAALRAFLFGYGTGARTHGDEECYWVTDLSHEVDELFFQKIKDKNYSDEELFDRYFEVFDQVISTDCPQYGK